MTPTRHQAAWAIRAEQGGCRTALSFDLQPGHDAWVDGSEPCVMWDTGVKPYAKPAG